jgi:hypothetical protein
MDARSASATQQNANSLAGRPMDAMECTTLLTLDLFADESHDSGRAHVISLAGLLAPRSDWTRVWRAWTAELAAEGIEVFHATECEGAQREFRGWSRTRLEAFQRRLIDVVVDPTNGIITYSTSLELRAYTALRPRLRAFLKFPPGLSINGPVDDPYFILFQQLIEMTARDEYVSDLPPEETVGFTFDRHHLAPRAKAVSEAMWRFRDFGPRIRGTGFMDKRQVVPLQVADLLAYETFRYEADTHLNGRPERWQHAALAARLRKSVFMDGAYLERMVDHMEEKVAQLRQSSAEGAT